MAPHARIVAVLAGLGAMLAVSDVLSAADCARTSVGLTPLNDLGAGIYLGQFQGGL